MDENQPDDLPPRLIANSRIVARACDLFLARKGLTSYDLKGNHIDPITKQLIHPKKKCKRSSKGSKR
jgi:hypothetical protein